MKIDMVSIRGTYFLLAFFLFFLAGCTRKETTTAGIEFTYLREGDGKVVEPGQFLLLDLRVEDEQDSVWMDTRAVGGEPQLVRVDAENPKVPDPGEIGVYRRLSKGDSVTFTLDVATIYEQTWMRPVPEHMDRDMRVTYAVVIRDVMDDRSMEAFRAKKEEEMNRLELQHQISQYGRDTVHIDSVLKARGKNALKNPSGIRYTVELEGKGAAPRRGDLARVRYQGYLTDGKVFDSNFDGDPLEVVVGTGKVIRGWDEMLQLMRPGGRYTIYIPSLLAYGRSGAPPRIPSDAVLIFDMEILSVVAQ